MDWAHRAGLVQDVSGRRQGQAAGPGARRQRAVRRARPPQERTRVRPRAAGPRRARGAAVGGRRHHGAAAGLRAPHRAVGRRPLPDRALRGRQRGRGARAGPVPLRRARPRARAPVRGRPAPAHRPRGAGPAHRGRGAGGLRFWTAVLERSRWKYGERFVRYVLLDAGHIAGNVALAATALGLGTCQIARLLRRRGGGHPRGGPGRGAGRFMSTAGRPAAA